MGTSSSATGPGSGVALVPPWVPNVVPNVPEGDEEEQDKEQSADQDKKQGQEQPAQQTELLLALPARFGAARRLLGSFARDGGHRDMRRGLGHYVRKGLGGAASATRRMGGTAAVAGALYATLTSAAEERLTPPDLRLLPGASVDDIMDVLVEAVCPVDGTMDREASRPAVKSSMADLLKRFPDVDLLNLSEEQRLLIVESYVAHDIFRRISLDVGKIVQDRSPSASIALARCAEIRDYVREVVAASFRQLRRTGELLTKERVAGMALRGLQATFEVFEEYVA